MTNEPIRSFTDDYAFLSNFYVESDGKSVEHYYQAAKTIDSDEYAKILDAPTPGVAKQLGKRVYLKFDWEEYKVPLMIRLVKLKFEQPELSELLVATGDRLLVEGNMWHDNVWGDCSCRECLRIHGSNWLGVILMTLRSSLNNRKEDSCPRKL